MSYLLEDWERVDEVNLLSILVHINPCKFYSYQPFLYRIHSCFAMSTFFPSSQCFFLSSHVYNAGLDWYTIIRSADAMLWVYRTVWETKTYSHRHRHNPSRAHRKRDIKKPLWVILLLRRRTERLGRIHVLWKDLKGMRDKITVRVPWCVTLAVVGNRQTCTKAR